MYMEYFLTSGFFWGVNVGVNITYAFHALRKMVKKTTKSSHIDH
jgi:hypothetical protein